MWTRPDYEHFVDEIYLAGERVSPGTYKQVGAPREVRLEEEDYLPASTDGRVACYVRLTHHWGDRARKPVNSH